MRHPRVERGPMVWKTIVRPSHPCRDAAARIRTGIPSPRTKDASVAPQQRCRQPESNRRPTFEGRRCLTALHHDGVAAPRFARGPRLCKSRILGARPCCRHSPLRKSGGPREKRPAIRRRRVVTRHPRRRAATAAVDSRGFEPRLRFARPACFQLHHEPIRPAKESDLLGPAGPARYPPTIAAWRLAVRPAGQRRKEWSRCPP